MSDPRQPVRRSSPEPARHLDPRSRRAIIEFLARLLGLSVIALGPFLFNSRPLHNTTGMLSLACALGAMFSTIRAVSRGDVIGRGSLNKWDEALAFVAVSRLAHLVHGFQT